MYSTDTKNTKLSILGYLLWIMTVEITPLIISNLLPQLPDLIRYSPSFLTLMPIKDQQQMAMITFGFTLL